MNLDEIIENALNEDIGEGDITSLTLIRNETEGKARIKVKDRGVLAGVPVAEKIFSRVDPSLALTLYKQDGERVKPGDIVLEVLGNIHSILAAERLVLNFMQRLSGIATLTSLMVARLKGLNTRVLDTRKTTPNLRELEKYAVRMGGGVNHRMGLYDMMLIKDNHVDIAGGMIPVMIALQRYKAAHKKSDIKVEIEVRNFDELTDVLEHGEGLVDRIMLDNFSLRDLADAVAIIDGNFETEASGGINMANVREYGETGVDFVSVGALTHNFRSLDMNMKVVLKSIFSDEW
ncbi:MAG: carboxylating nicotinate-nucleotide diphosphorylase [Bacteroidetes bacterium]|nr:carboxylating nicotinate-nucleotide diphosphorylase [Bacteroidota bacterium]